MAKSTQNLYIYRLWRVLIILTPNTKAAYKKMYNWHKLAGIFNTICQKEKLTPKYTFSLFLYVCVYIYIYIYICLWELWSTTHSSLGLFILSFFRWLIYNSSIHRLKYNSHYSGDCVVPIFRVRRPCLY